jgi:hypothetical protein
MGCFEIVQPGPDKRKFLSRFSMENAKIAKPEQKPHWHPFDCESCNAVFDERTWQADYSISGELSWECPACHHSNYWRLDWTMTEALKPLFEKLASSRFTGELHIRFEDGQIESAKLEHFLAFSEFGRELPTIDGSDNQKHTCQHCSDGPQSKLF